MKSSTMHMRTGFDIGKVRIKRGKVRWRCWFVPIIVGLISSGCASVDTSYRDPRDPWEPFNRSVHVFNEKLDDYVAKPLARGYQAITPDAVDYGITNFFSNLYDVTVALNNLLQGKFRHALIDIGRFGVNSTVGVLGVMDIATGWGLERHDEDFGQTLGKWGFNTGPYLVLPVIGPSNVRDAVGFAGDWVSNPIYFQIDSVAVSWSMYIVRYIDRRSDRLKAERILDTATMDPYSFIRDSYLQRRGYLVQDGEVEEIEDDIFEGLD